MTSCRSNTLLELKSNSEQVSPRHFSLYDALSSSCNARRSGRTERGEPFIQMTCDVIIHTQCDVIQIEATQLLTVSRIFAISSSYLHEFASQILSLTEVRFLIGFHEARCEPCCMTYFRLGLLSKGSAIYKYILGYILQRSPIIHRSCVFLCRRYEDVRI